MTWYWLLLVAIIGGLALDMAVWHLVKWARP